MADNQTIGRCDCHACKELVFVKLNKNRIAYYFCDCGAHAKWGRADSNKLIAKAARMDRQGKPEAANDNELGLVKGKYDEPGQLPAAGQSADTTTTEGAGEAEPETGAAAGAAEGGKPAGWLGDW